MLFKKEIILIGTFHFEQDREIMENKEGEIEEFVDYLSDFKPSKVALEWEKEQNDNLNKEYKISNGNYLIDEVQQVGFRLAKKLEHNRVYAVNWTGHLTQGEMTNLNNTIQRSYPGVLNSMRSMSENGPIINSNTNLIDSYRKLNDSDYVRELEEMYLSFVLVEDDMGERIGVNFLTKWAERELMIVMNIIETTADNSDERILLIIGSDHLWMLRKLFEGSGWDVINPFIEST
ncbi:DUF5694 domain-containing protein [Virgibacillus sp. DJP39]|uniref:DUF5694 domain-containing protein n=1 Tax=Virgibacillus sp. DJP39 TaxID=3409790 RepID=UPI003BB7F207